MPENEKFWNPYRMVGPQERHDCNKTITHEKFHGICGHISGRIRALTPIFIGSQEQGYFIKVKSDNKYFIPGSSFKGMLRSLLELVGHGCSIVGNDQCMDTENLCAACRIFGMSLSGKSNVLFQGKVYIADLRIIGSTQIPQPKEVLLGTPKSHHSSFYQRRSYRKYYHHQNSTSSNIVNPLKQKEMIRKIRPLPTGTEFGLDIQCDNMTPYELGLLLYCLELEKDLVVEFSDGQGENFFLCGDLHHKIGGGKPLGYGSIAVEIAPKQEDFYEPKQRYSSLGKHISPLSEKLWTQVRLEQEKYHINGDYDSDLLKQLRAMLLFPSQSNPDPREYKYPNYEWFDENSQVTLKPIYESMRKGNSNVQNK